MTDVILFNKPFNVLCQFTSIAGKQTLANYIKQPGFYAAGRLDQDSEGLILLTNNGLLNALITQPKNKMWKTYLVQVEGQKSESACAQLRSGIVLKDGLTKPAFIRIIPPPVWLWDRTPPIRQRKNIADHWIEIKIAEGKNRQIRRMTAAVGLPTLRLIRTAIGPFELNGLPCNAHRQVAIPSQIELLLNTKQLIKNKKANRYSYYQRNHNN
ncbi:UNVERIFIED_CONTAM: hypothetical protein GTU68_001246 [Idotea baltica]|nr:hypothetical protein [Idotea baltica]